MTLVGEPRREVERVGILRSANAEHQAPKRNIRDGCPGLVFQLTEEGSARGIEGVDCPVSEITDQNIVAELAEAGAGLRHTPRRIQRAVGGESLHEVALETEDVDDSIAGCIDGVVLGVILHCVSTNTRLPTC